MPIGATFRFSPVRQASLPGWRRRFDANLAGGYVDFRPLPELYNPFERQYAPADNNNGQQISGNSHARLKCHRRLRF